MLLGDMLRNLQDETQATEVLIGMNDLVRLAHVQECAARYDETAGEYAANAVRGFANQASDEDWLALTTAIENADDAAQICLSRMIDWALKQDSAPPAHQGCTCGGHHP